MSYLVLARKSRPRSFAEVIGQRAVVTTLQNSLKKDRVAHAILFSGVRGVGKTTLARIMAKALNCQGEQTSPPCNSCPSCQAINAGASLDLHEIDGASNRGIQEIRELKEKIRFLPTSSRYKIIIIDEVHMLTSEAFNALLKTLEEPPAHVYFMFATTELHKIPITILSRCQQYELKRIGSDDLHQHFSRLAEAEGVAIAPEAMALIVREAEGSVRDGLSLLDQVFSFGEQHITTQDVIEVLGLVNRQVLHTLAAALLTGDRKAALTALAEISAFGMDSKRFSNDLLSYFRNLLLCKIEGCGALLDLPEQDIAALHDLAAEYSLPTIHQKLVLLMRLMDDIRHSSQPRLSLESGFIAIIEAGNVVPVTTLLAQLEDLLSRGNAPAEVAMNAKKNPSSSPTVTAKTIVQPPAASSMLQQEVSSPSPGIAVPVAPDSVTTISPVISQAKPSEELVVLKTIPQHWPDFINHVRKKKEWMAQNLLQAERTEQIDTTLHLYYRDQESCALLQQKEHCQVLQDYLHDFFGKVLSLAFHYPEKTAPEKAALADSENDKRRLLANDPLTIKVVEMFNGHIANIRTDKH